MKKAMTQKSRPLAGVPHTVAVSSEVYYQISLIPKDFANARVGHNGEALSVGC